MKHRKKYLERLKNLGIVFKGGRRGIMVPKFTDKEFASWMVHGEKALDMNKVKHVFKPIGI